MVTDSGRYRLHDFLLLLGCGQHRLVLRVYHRVGANLRSTVVHCIQDGTFTLHSEIS